ncbi:adenylyl-sulfate kinase [Pseudomonas asiatica]|uniref:Adenylyl-sulfate kinase n=1 Tax=Pseudomonas asiatica TaxID=2219225 RepID=A0ABU5L070_9PSED|nr:adenylyl-sulfate kinase [Pseudomonas asiatica]MDZ5739556.1 adenylyl-sulfate kinase [Pseudomonas asiatica]MDZ5746378.1 adenylyl-sulfate kinase [Pseudomonas asiatica]MDZ5751210.1 adenylyl-sulfate kinase [Pseudomonas asiatica]MDZ5754073.1 adenylyl-sulfate kinase [Pseudomonas asiatica]WJM54986.1 adenylyl-sulfate kinase [Pseudomonas asiatica]
MQNKNIVWQHGVATRDDRRRVLNQVPLTLWLTGLSASGKSVVSYALEAELLKRGLLCAVLDGDNLRHGLNSDLDFSPQARSENIRRAAEVARLMNDIGLIVIVALISPLRTDRQAAQSIVGVDLFREIYVSTALEICESRDPKGLYRAAREGGIAEFTGVSAPYEPPLNPSLMLDTGSVSVHQSVEMICSLIKTTSS